jgi:hypothetical protein
MLWSAMMEMSHGQWLEFFNQAAGKNFNLKIGNK